jgi:hypothetical protein
MLAVTGRHGAGKTRLLAEDFAAESRFGRPRGGSAAFCRKYPETAGWEKRFGSLSRADA